jgi:membrane protein implicated in regulation of membrane protease activity
MPTDLASVLLLVVTAAATFLLARFLSRKRRDGQRKRDETQQRAGESRQVRRARERRGK